MREGWFDIETDTKLRLRTQFVYNYRKLYERLIEECNRRIAELDERIDEINGD